MAPASSVEVDAVERASTSQGWIPGCQLPDEDGSIFDVASAISETGWRSSPLLEIEKNILINVVCVVLNYYLFIYNLLH